MNKKHSKLLRLVAMLTVVFTFVAMLSGCTGSEGSKGKLDLPGDETKAPTVASTAAPTTEPTTAPTTEPTEPPKVKMDVPDLAEYVQKRTVTLNVTLKDGTSRGSGFFIDDQGTLVTSYHVIDGAIDIEVEVSDGAKYAMKEIVDFSELLDLAVIKLDITDNPFLALPEEAARTGEDVYAVGSSLGFLDGTFSNGIISNSSRYVGQIECIQTTAAISNGNSGGPLVNAFGEVIGINAFSYTGGENLNLAVKIENLDKLGMDKHWNINKYKEWYDKEISRSFMFYDYEAGEYVLSKVNTYQHVTGTECMASAADWSFLEGDFEYVVEGYDAIYGLFFYEYDVNAFDQYTEYLATVGFEYNNQESYNEGVSYYYVNPFTGMKVDIFILDGDELMVIEPYCNAD